MAADTSHSGTIFDHQMIGDILYPGFWLVENCSTVRCICCHWTLYPKNNFPPIRTCLTHTQFHGMMVGHVSFHWTYIALHSVLWNYQENLPLPSSLDPNAQTDKMHNSFESPAPKGQNIAGHVFFMGYAMPSQTAKIILVFSCMSYNWSLSKNAPVVMEIYTMIILLVE